MWRSVLFLGYNINSATLDGTIYLTIIENFGHFWQCYLNKTCLERKLIEHNGRIICAHIISWYADFTLLFNSNTYTVWTFWSPESSGAGVSKPSDGCPSPTFGVRGQGLLYSPELEQISLRESEGPFIHTPDVFCHLYMINIRSRKCLIRIFWVSKT